MLTQVIFVPALTVKVPGLKLKFLILIVTAAGAVFDGVGVAEVDEDPWVVCDGAREVVVLVSEEVVLDEVDVDVPPGLLRKAA